MDKIPHIALTKEEIREIHTDAELYTAQAVDIPANRIFGADVHETPYAPQIRDLQLRVSEHMIEYRVPEIQYRMDRIRDNIEKEMRLRLEGYVLADVTELHVTFDWDVWAPLKLWAANNWVGKLLVKMKKERWMCVKQRTKVIHGNVLYPYLKVSFPWNKHTVKLRFPAQP